MRALCTLRRANVPSRESSNSRNFLVKRSISGLHVSHNGLDLAAEIDIGRVLALIADARGVFRAAVKGDNPPVIVANGRTGGADIGIGEVSDQFVICRGD